MFKQVFPLLSILFFRFLGLFIVLPVISLLVATMEHASIINVGIAIGAPYLFQVIFQPLFGRLSDRYGRKPVLLIGLVIFLIGSIVCMLADSIYYLIIGRCLQGIGAIGGILTALVADCVPEEKRMHAMAIMGVGIFASFIVAMILGSFVGGTSYGLGGLFGLSAFLSLVSIIIAVYFVKSKDRIAYAYMLDSNIYNKEITRSIVIACASNFIEKFLMIFTFSIVPIALSSYMDKSNFYAVYIIAVFFAILSLAPASIFSEKKGKSLQVLSISIALFFTCYLGLALFIENVGIFSFCFVLFFIAFSIQEALLQSLVSKYAKASVRGAVIGDFSAAGFAGSFFGAMLGGVFHDYSILIQWHGIIFFIVATLMVIWGFVARKWLANPHNAKMLYIRTEDIAVPQDLMHSKLESFLRNESIIEWYENVSENIMIIKYRIDRISPIDITNLLKPATSKES